jgi:hypothetical protein
LIKLGPNEALPYHIDMIDEMVLWQYFSVHFGFAPTIIIPQLLHSPVCHQELVQ